MGTKPSSPGLSKGRILWRGIKGRCPKCGEGRLFKNYIQQVERCTCCGEAIGRIRADDGPAWLTILLTGHIVAPLIGYFALHDTLPSWLATALLLAIALFMVFLILPRAKGLFIAMINSGAK
jgi:uncharacterized protein (DUF983 family)